VDGIESSELSGLESSCRPYHRLIHLDEGEPRQDAMRSSDRPASDPSCHPLRLDASDNARDPLRPRSKKIAKGLRLRFGHDQLHDGRRVQVQELSRHAIVARLSALAASSIPWTKWVPSAGPGQGGPPGAGLPVPKPPAGEARNRIRRPARASPPASHAPSPRDARPGRRVAGTETDSGEALGRGFASGSMCTHTVASLVKLLPD